MDTFIRRITILLALVTMGAVAAACGSDDGGAAASGDFDTDTVRKELVSGDEGEEQAIRVFFVGEGDDEALTEQSVACVEHFQEEYDKVQCWSFASEEYWETSQVNDEGQMVRMCWSTYARTPVGDEDEIKTDFLRERFREQYQCDGPPEQPAAGAPGGADGDDDVDGDDDGDDEDDTADDEG